MAGPRQLTKSDAPPKKRVLISYSRAAKEFVDRLEQKLSDKGLEPLRVAERDSMLRQCLAIREGMLALACKSYRIAAAIFVPFKHQQVNVDSAQLALLRVQSKQLAQRINLHLALGGNCETQPQSAA